MNKRPNKLASYACLECNFISGNKNDYTKHTLTRKHINKTNTISLTNKTPLEFNCKVCDYTTSNKKDYLRHTLTRKHTILSKIQNSAVDPPTKNAIEKQYICVCKKTYKHLSSLWNHKKTCSVNESFTGVTDSKSETIDSLRELQLPSKTYENEHLHENSTNHFVSISAPIQSLPIQSAPIQPVQNISNEVIYELLKEIAISNQQNTEFKQMLIDQQSKIIELSSKTGNNNTINNHNTQINVNMFLNEYCKDAVTLTKFIESIKPSFEDVMYMSDKGNVAGLTKILKTALGGLAITDRPLHCTDVKRHTTWVKEADGWQKDQEQVNLKRLCNKVEHACLIKTMDIIQGDENYLIDGTAEYEHVHKMMLEAGGGAERHVHNIPIVVRNIEENIKLDKEQIQEAVK